MTEPSLSFGRFRFGHQDPTCSLDDGCLRLAAMTPDGPATLTAGPSGPIRFDGPGRTTLEARSIDPRGERDTFRSLEHDCPAAQSAASYPVVRELEKRWGHVRFGRTGDVYRAAVTSVLGQRITAAEAVRQWRRLCLTYGVVIDALVTPPEPARLAALVPYELHRHGIEEARARTIIAVAQVFDRPGSHHVDTDAAMRRLDREVPRFGPWTQALVRAEALGDPDSVAVGDFHLKNVVATSLARRPRGTDDEMLELLAPYAGQRGRVLSWLSLEGVRAPKFGPRRRNIDIRRL
jgi:hypothetical protein